MTNQITMTHEEIAKLMAVSIYGFCAGVHNIPMTKEQIKDVYEATLESIQEGGFIEELVQIYDNEGFEDFAKDIREL